MSKTILIFCEGKSMGNENQSLDIKILWKFLKFIPNTTIIPFGGKRSEAAFVDGYLKRGGVIKPDFAFVLRDRDFDFPIPQSCQLITGKTSRSEDGQVVKKRFAFYRTCIENYLLSAALLFQFIELTLPNIKISEHDFKEIFKMANYKIRFYSAARHALGEIQLPVKIRSTWTEGSGSLPFNLTKSECLEKAKKIIQSYKTPLESVNESLLETTYQQYVTLFDSSEFYDSHQYLIYFNGKDIQKSFSVDFNSVFEGNINWKKYYQFAIEQTNFTQFQDLNQFLEEVKNASES